MNMKEASKEIKRDLSNYKDRMRQSFVDASYQIHAGIIKKFYTASKGSAVGLSRRTGKAAKSWKVDVKRSNDNVTCSIYSAGAPYADFSEKKVIVPKTKKWLTIPVGPALTKAGAPRYPGGARQAERAMTMPPVRHGFRRQGEGSRKPFKFYQKDSNTAFLIAKPGVKGTGLTKKDRILFVLKKKVTLPAKTQGLMPWVDKRVNSFVSKLSASQSGRINLEIK